MSRLTETAGRVYRGDTTVDFVGRTKVWYAIAGAVVAVSLLSLLVLRLNLGIEFTGGAEFRAPTGSTTVAEARAAVDEVPGVGEAIVQTVGPDLRVQTQELADEAQVQAVREALAGATGVGASDVTISTVGAAWGSQITTKALQGLVLFLVVVVLYLSVRFEPKMAVAALVALVHDLVVTLGVFSLLGFEVTPATVIGLLTILGYSLYDTVVVFDKVKENTAGLLERPRATYSEAANRAINQMLARSINTSVIALLPVGGLLFVGAGLLGAGTLVDLSLALFVGITAGTYSSIFIATPVLAQLKEREDAYQVLRRSIVNRRRQAGEDVDGTMGDALAPAPATAPAPVAASAGGSVLAPTSTTVTGAPGREAGPGGVAPEVRSDGTAPGTPPRRAVRSEPPPAGPRKDSRSRAQRRRPGSER